MLCNAIFLISRIHVMKLSYLPNNRHFCSKYLFLRLIQYKNLLLIIYQRLGLKNWYLAKNWYILCQITDKIYSNDINYFSTEFWLMIFRFLTFSISKFLDRQLPNFILKLRAKTHCCINWLNTKRSVCFIESASMNFIVT